MRYAARHNAATLQLTPDEHREHESVAHATSRAVSAYLRNPAVFQSEEHCQKWLVLTVRNYIKDCARRLRARLCHEPRYERGESIPDHSDLIEQMRRAVTELPTEMRHLVGLLLQGRSFACIASEIGVPTSTAHDRYRQALQVLRAKMATYGATVEDLFQANEVLLNIVEKRDDEPDDY